VAIDSLTGGGSPRLAGINMDHARTLAELVGHSPPIVVHRRTMRVIDGMHRVAAAKLLGMASVTARFFEGTEAVAFELAVRANVTHGLPLTLAERRAAAAQLIRTHTNWSDRRIAAAAGLSPKTVGAIRSRSSEEIPQLPVRIGRDDRVRQVRHPPVTKNVVAVTSIPESRIEKPELTHSPGRVLRYLPATGSAPRATAVETLRKDPSLRFTEIGRILLRLLDLHTVEPQVWGKLIDGVPPHLSTSVAVVARSCADTWRMFADQVSEIESVPGSP
jgi:hypothetical protein